MSAAKYKPKKKSNNKRALILVGGYGTRLRPLTFSVAKPLVPFANTPILEHQVKALSEVDVKEIILAVNYKPADLMEWLPVAEAKYGVKIILSREEEPMGTAGPVALAKEYLDKDDSPFFMFNSDVICDFPLADMLKFHLAHKKEGTIMVTRVQDPSKYGVIVTNDEGEIKGEIKSFIEKPKVFVSDKINAGIYILNPSMIRRIPMKPTSIEREIFPEMAKDLQLFSWVLPGYWMDIGQPKDYLTGMCLHLGSLRGRAPGDLAGQQNFVVDDQGKFKYDKKADNKASFKIIGNVLVDPSARIGAGSVIGPDVVVGPNVILGEGVRIKRTTLLEGVKVLNSAFINSSIIGWKSKIGAWARVDSSILGEDVEVGDETALSEVTCCPHKGIKEDTVNKVLL